MKLWRASDAPMPKKARLSGIKSFRTYTIKEAAEVTGVSERTIGNWVSNGLRVLDDERPALFRGDDLREFIKCQRADRKVKTELDQFYCVCCRKPREAAEGFAECTVIGNRAKLTAFCETCETIVSKAVPKAFVPKIARTLTLTIKRHETTL
jgi:excisionase family DNA binding protein